MQKKKGFRGDEFNPAAAFISNASQVKSEEATPYDDSTHNAKDAHNAHDAPGGVGYTPHMDETKTRRVNLLIRPSLFEDFRKVAHMKRTSTNDLLNRLIAECTEQEGAAIRDYNRLFKDAE